MFIQEIVTWLKERSALNILEETTLSAIASELQERSFSPQQKVIVENTVPDGLYILLEGRLESMEGTLRPVSLLPGVVLNLQELLLDEKVESTILSLNDAKLWYIEADKFKQVVQAHPNITQIFSQKLAKEVEELVSQLSFEQERQAILRPYLVTKAKRGIVGKTQYAVRLRSQIQAASQNRDPVIIFGEPGLEKDNIAALIHFGSSYRQQPIIKLDCSILQPSGAELLGRVAGKPGLIEAVNEGTIIFNNIEELPKELLPILVDLLQNKVYYSISNYPQPTQDKKVCKARIIMISETSIPLIDQLVKNIIKVPPLRVRKADINYQVNYYLNIICSRKGINKLQITPEALRRLQAYDFPNNLRELENLIERATIQLSGSSIITEEIIWPSQSKKKQFRLNLLNGYPALRHFLRSSWYPDKINYGFTSIVFPLIIAILFLGPQERSSNFALNIFWAWWWPLSLIAFPFVGRIWCAFCPFMIYGEIVQKVSLYLYPRELKKWPRQTAEKWGGWFLFGLFALILLWEELWNLPNTAYLSACLLLLITAGAMIFSLIFERRLWCRYLCPIGGMNGMFAKLSMTELRAQQGTCSAECTTYQCYKGGPAKGEGLETNGCPLYSHPAQLNDNRDCVLCMTCLKACPHRSVELNLRPPGIELWTTHLPRKAEVALLLLLLDGVFLHYLKEILSFLHLNLDLSSFVVHSGVAIIVLTLPALLPLLGSHLSHLLGHKRSIVELAYGYLPLVLGANLAYYLQWGLGEAGTILPVTLATFGLSIQGVPVWVAQESVIAFLQGVTLLSGLFTSVILVMKIAKQPCPTLLPQHFCSLILTILFWRLIV